MSTCLPRKVAEIVHRWLDWLLTAQALDTGVWKRDYIEQRIEREVWEIILCAVTFGWVLGVLTMLLVR